MDAFTWIVIGLLYLSLICHFPSNFVSNISPTLFGCRFNFLWWFSALRAIRDVRLFFWEIPNLFQVTFGRNSIRSEFKNALWSRSYFSSLSGLAKFPLSSLPFFYGCWHSNEFSLNTLFSLVISAQFSSFFFLVWNNLFL